MSGAKIIVVANVNGVLSCLYLCSGDNQTWSLPGGGMEPKDKSLEACARRELEEEAGLQGQITDLGDGVYLHVYEGDPNTYVSPRQPDPHDTSRYTYPYGPEYPMREDAFEHVDEIWAPLEESPGRFINDNGGYVHGRCEAEWDRLIRPNIEKIKQKVPHLVSERYSLKARLLNSYTTTHSRVK